jgi:hypothetical protein
VLYQLGPSRALITCSPTVVIWKSLGAKENGRRTQPRRRDILGPAFVSDIPVADTLLELWGKKRLVWLMLTTFEVAGRNPNGFCWLSIVLVLFSFYGWWGPHGCHDRP